MTLGAAQKLIPFSLKNVDGKTVSQDDLASARALAVIFWCNHCPYVRAWEDRVIALQREYADKGARFVLINANDPVKYPGDSFEEMQARAKELGYPFPYLVDETQEVARAYGAERTPEIYLFDQARTLRYHGAPDDNYEDPKAVGQQFFRDAIEAVLADKAPSTSDTPARGCTIKWK